MLAGIYMFTKVSLEVDQINKHYGSFYFHTIPTDNMQSSSSLSSPIEINS